MKHNSRLKINECHEYENKSISGMVMICTCVCDDRYSGVHIYGSPLSYKA